ncbi:MAG: AEC family transporter [Coriobacteriales bacterium]|jgi:predicted permease
MADMSGAISQMVILLIVMGVGILATKLGYLDDYIKGKLTKLILNITLPCMIVASSGSIDVESLGSDLGWAFGLGALMFFLFLATGWICNVVLRVPYEERNVYLFMSFLTNTSFIGIPVVAAIYGNQTVLLSSVVIMALTVLIYSVGFAIVRKDEQGSSVSRAVKDAVLNPMTIASLIAVLFLFARVQLPQVVQGSLETIGGLTAPVAMLLVGVIIAGMDIKGALTEWRLYPFILIRNFIAPLLLYLALRGIVPDATVLGISVVMFAMPVGSMAAPTLGELGYEQELPAKGTVMSTLAGFAVVPAVVHLMAVL